MFTDLIEYEEFMFKFWDTLTNLISQYTIADTAYVWAIIESFATLATAVGAFIAVIVTIRIAKNQDALFVEQNRISATQAEIAKYQNHISLFSERNEAHEYFLAFFSIWEGFPAMLSIINDTNALLDFMVTAYQMSAVNVYEFDSTNVSIDDTESIKRFEMIYFRTNALEFGKTLSIFNFSDEQLKYLRSVRDKFSILLLSIFGYLKSNKIEHDMLLGMSVLLMTELNKSSKEIMKVINDQIQLTDK